ncbi:MAG: UvrB/UvrC motif-containing protein, partial [Gemmatimonadetes bacterium]|nr:UvrB/UvrC motif-containing protein [Gemmatimonadota bacterium]
LRSDRSLIQTVGRAARHVEGRAILYADRITGSMRRAIDETDRRRAVQVAHNLAHGIVPRGVTKSTDQIRVLTRVADAREEREGREKERAGTKKQKKVAEAAAHYGTADLPGMVTRLEAEMKEAAKALDFETAARLRDELFEIKTAMGERSGGASGSRRQAWRPGR